MSAEIEEREETAGSGSDLDAAEDLFERLLRSIDLREDEELGAIGGGAGGGFGGSGDGGPLVGLITHFSRDSNTLSDAMGMVEMLRGALHSVGEDVGRVAAQFLDYVREDILTAKGDLLSRTASALARLPIGATTGHVLTVDPASSVGMSWQAGGGPGAASIEQYAWNGI